MESNIESDIFFRFRLGLERGFCNGAEGDEFRFSSQEIGEAIGIWFYFGFYEEEGGDSIIATVTATVTVTVTAYSGITATSAIATSVAVKVTGTRDAVTVTSPIAGASSAQPGSDVASENSSSGTQDAETNHVFIGVSFHSIISL